MTGPKDLEEHNLVKAEALLRAEESDKFDDIVVCDLHASAIGPSHLPSSRSHLAGPSLLLQIYQQLFREQHTQTGRRVEAPPLAIRFSFAMTSLTFSRYKMCADLLSSTTRATTRALQAPTLRSTPP
jgi:hypothetical protein